MKKVLGKIISLTAVTALALAFTACSLNDDAVSDLELFYAANSGSALAVSNGGSGTGGSGTGGSGAAVTNSTGVWNFSSRTTAPTGANAWDASTALTSDVNLDANSGTGTFTVLTGAKAKYNSGLQFSNGSSAKNLFNITGTGSVSITYNAPSDATTGKPFFLYAEGDEANKVTATSGKPSGTYTVTISGTKKFYSNDCRILNVSFN